ncbi:MAG: extracellular solute-binding protein, partial [Paenibacillaceae bacterium]|nr:extracellular solute-binding protein [Paenibacillaceae bacterium]
LKSANTDANKEVYGSIVPSELTFFETVAQSSGGNLLSPDNRSVSGYLDSRPVSEAFALLAQHLNADNAVKKVENMGNATLLEMRSGNVGMSISVYGMYYFLEQYKGTTGKTAVAPLPRLEKGKKVNSSTFSILSIAAVSKEKEIAWKFIKDEILNSDSEFHRDWSRQEMLTSKAAIKKLNQADDPILRVFYEELNYLIAPVSYRNPAFPSLFTAKTVQSLLDTSSSDAAQAFLTDTAHKIDEQLALVNEPQKE